MADFVLIRRYHQRLPSDRQNDILFGGHSRKVRHDFLAQSLQVKTAEFQFLVIALHFVDFIDISDQAGNPVHFIITDLQTLVARLPDAVKHCFQIALQCRKRGPDFVRDIGRKAVPDFLLAVQLAGKAVHRTDQRIYLDDVRFLRRRLCVVAFGDFPGEAAHRKDRQTQFSGYPNSEKQR